MIYLRSMILLVSLLIVQLGCVLKLMAQEHKYMGVGSCSSSNCHGSTSPRKSTTVLQNEYVTWFKHDKHAKAWEVLGNEDSSIIAKHLGINSAQKEPLCLSCHATYSEAELYGPKARIEDGVGCESCHGPAEGWLAEHATKGSTYRKNVERGLFDVVSASARAKLCSDCHFGAENREVTHRLIGAGHPRLAFELDTFSAIEPWHWEVDDDYIKRKGQYRSAEFWLVGQLELATRTIDRLNSSERTKDGMWPELSLFTCYSCHHSLSSNQYQRWEYDGKPGEFRLNLSSVLMVREAVQVINPELAGKLGAAISNLHQQYRLGDRTAAVTELNEILRKEVKSAISSFNYNSADLRKLVIQFATLGGKANYQYEDAEQISMAISAVLATISPGKQPHKIEMQRLYKSLANPKEYKAEDFRAASEQLAKAVDKLK